MNDIENIQKNGAYFVASNGDAPHQMYFDLGEAVEGEDEYIDVFDSNGCHIGTMIAQYQMDGDRRYIDPETTNPVFTGYEV